ncbi:TGS domain-containing protein [Spiroplasma endosymbiont of Diplazon laetatorius]|uniref:TGS domain-containing protein n=1 Tax=Spiroplasma endosymbiont of Diplazon laetatorius TaxID=3066322 RepID=UPI0030D62657
MKLTLLDGQIVFYEEPRTVLEIAKDISEALGKRCVGALINSSYIVSCFTEINKDCKIEFITERHDLYYQIVNYTAKLVTILSLVELYPDLEPIVQDGDNSKLEFNLYYNGKHKIEEADFELIEQGAKKIINESYSIENYEASKYEFISKYKQLNIRGNVDELIKNVEKKYISFPVLKLNGESFFSLCGTLKNTSELYEIKITKVEDYLLDDGKDNVLIQQIHGIAASSEKEFNVLKRELELDKVAI